MKTRGFDPDEIIFASTTACNLHCEHCFVNRKPLQLDIEQAVAFLRDCAASGKIERVGFSGGEPFLYMDFLIALTKETVALDLLFDQIMTNGDWWKDEADLRDKLRTLYDAGYDGKIGLSWDEYHGQSQKRMETFIGVVKEMFGNDSVSIQVVEGNSQTWIASPAARNDGLVYLPRTYPAQDPRAWQAHRWFSEDYCQGPGNIFYVHADGNIAPCCGFANENQELFIGNIEDSWEKIINNAAGNKMVELCFNRGLSRYRRQELKKVLRQKGQKLPGKTSDICSFCDYVCKLQ
jgi:MoaA/NifB/PqqE/SkfB family radical SAM enzyme